MDELSIGMTTYKVPAEEVEALLATKYGNRLQPVDTVQLAKLRNMQKQQEHWKLASWASRRKAPKDPPPELN